MVDKIASRRAGFNLLKILLLLFLPIGLFGYFYTQEAKNDIRVIERELKGLHLVNFAAPILFGATNDLTDAQHRQMLALEAELLGPSPEQSFDQLMNAENTMRSEAASDYIYQVLSDSGLVFDAQSESYYLIISVLANLPDVVTDSEQLVSTAKTYTSSTTAETPPSLFVLVGHAQEALERLSETLAAAKASSEKPGEYAHLEDLVSQISSEMEAFTASLAKGREAVAGGGSSGVQAVTAWHMGENATELWSLTAGKVEALLTTRLGNLKRTYRLLLALGFVSAFLALGYGFQLFRNSLKKLDDVENARAAEAAARVDAENMSAKLVEMNDGMVTLNRDLAANITGLKAAQHELVKKGRMEQLGQLTATIAHELRNPLGAVRTSAFLVERKIKDKGLGVEVQLERINKGVVRCDNIITQLLDYSRTKKLEAKPGNLDQWLANTVQEVAKQVPSAVQIECVLGLDDALVPFDTSRLERAITNLLVNASEAMIGSGEDPSKITTSHPFITVNTYRSNGFACIKVTDNGPGISSENMMKIREPLFTTKSFGTGLGIPAIEQIANQHDGRLDIRSELGKGAIFILSLPMTELKEAA